MKESFKKGLEQRDWCLEETGGGCTAFIKETVAKLVKTGETQECYLIMTTGSKDVCPEPVAPEEFPVAIGLCDDDGDFDCIEFAENFEEVDNIERKHLEDYAYGKLEQF